jgi:hypothetical protein
MDTPYVFKKLSNTFNNLFFILGPLSTVVYRPRILCFDIYGYRARSKIVGYGRRCMAETAISRFKALFGEHLLSRKPRWIDSELTIKAFIYNMLLSAVTT